MKPADSAWPFVTVIMPVRNEQRFIENVLAAVLEQDYPSDRWELVVADGASSDGTRALVQAAAARDSRIRLIDNPRRFVSPGLNEAIRQARGEIIVRLDGHCEYPRNYLRSVVRLREQTQADNVGGVLVPAGDGFVQRAVAAAYHSPVGLGGVALRGHDDSAAVREVDAVHGGCWRRERLLAAGGFDDAMVRNQDDELSFRLRRLGGRIVQSSTIRVRYHVRETFWKLFQQFTQYGYWKVFVILKHPRQSSLRHFVPGGFLALTLALAAMAAFNAGAAKALAVLWTLYLLVVALASLGQALRAGWPLWPGIILAVVTMHLGYGTGFLLGILRSLTRRLPTDSLFEQLTR